MAVLNDLSVIDSFKEVIPRASGLGEQYLRAVAAAVQEHSPPVTMSIEDVPASRSFGTPSLRCLAITPDSKKLKWYRTLHFATPLGSSLNVGWYLLGGDRENGRQFGAFNFGSISQHEVNEVESIVQLVHQYAVMPAINTIARTAMGGSASPTGGFFGA